MRGLADTSVFIAGETDRPLGSLPDDVALSVITLEELALGVRMAEARGDEALATRRRSTLEEVGAVFDVLPVDRRVASECARIRAASRQRGGRRIGPMDALIAATAASHGLPLYTQDTAFADLDGLDVRVI